MDEELWTLTRDNERASAVVRDRGVNGFDRALAGPRSGPPEGGHYMKMKSAPAI